MLTSTAFAQQKVSKQPHKLDLVVNKGFTQPFNSSQYVYDAIGMGDSAFDLFSAPNDKNYSFQLKENSLFGEEFVMGMHLNDKLSLRLNVMDGDETNLSLFSVPTTALEPRNQGGSDLAGYQLGVSSVFKLGDQWRLGFDLGRGQLDGDYLGLGQDNMTTTSLGFGIRYNQFSASVNSDFFSLESSDLIEQSTLDLKVDWHFTKDGTISIGARKGAKENDNVHSVLDQLNGTVPYIKFKHNL